MPSLTRIGVVLFISGFCSLVYQVTWLRLLRLIFGSSTTSTAVVLAIFMGGLGLGGVLLGRRAERVKNPLGFYATIEIGIGLGAAASPLLILVARHLYLGIGGESTLGLTGATVLRLLLAVLVLGVPAILMGGTLPAVAQAMERASDRGRRIVATLYGVNTLGAVTGAFLTTFVLIELLGVRQSLWLAAAVNLLLGLVVRSMARRATPVEAGEIAAGEAAEIAAGEAAVAGAGQLHGPEDEVRPAVVRIVLLAAFVVGFVFFLMELVWYRMLGPILGGSSYTFGLILTIALLGIGSGGWLYSREARGERPTLQALAATCGLEALFLIVPFALGDRLAYLALVVRSLAAQGFGSLVLGWALVAGIVVLPAAVVAGYQFPMLVALLGSGRRRVGPEVGQAYGWNTLGAILGSLAGGFALLPLLSAPRLWRSSAVVLVAIAAVLFALAGKPRGRWTPMPAAPGLLPIGCCVLSLLLCLAPGPSAFWRHAGIGAGRLDRALTYNPNDLQRNILTLRRTLFREAEGVESSLALRRGNGLALYVNGKSDGAVGDAPTTVMLGLVGAFLHPSPEKVLVIGLGTGMTAGWLAEVPEVDQVVVVELEPAVVAMAREFESMTFGVTDHPKVRMVFGDGREHVRTTSETYDLIVSEPSNPYRAGVADLFSREFYEAVSERLNPGGIFVQWLQGYEVDPSLVGVAYSTLGSIFPSVESWQINIADLLLVATPEPLVHDADRGRERASREPYRSALAKAWRVAGLEGLYAGYIGNPGLAKLAGEQDRAVSTDDRPLIEYGFARNLGRRGLFRITDLLDLAKSTGVDRPVAQGSPIDWDRVRELRQARVGAGNYAGKWDARSPQEQARFSARLAYGKAEIDQAWAAWSSQEGQPMSPFDRLLVAEGLIEGGDAAAAAAVAALEPDAPTEAALLEADLRWRSGDAESAFQHLVRGLRLLREDPWAYAELSGRALDLVSRVASHDPRYAARLFEILEQPFAAYRFDLRRRLKRVELATVVGFAERCGVAFGQFEPYPLWDERFLEDRLRCYQQTDHRLADTAGKELGAFYANRPRPLYDPRRGAPPAGQTPRAP